ncbi:alpha beta-hydrolase [Cyathus striatus]|nr:alpha beta-hydrolase [Cyathus striatus]
MSFSTPVESWLIGPSNTQIYTVTYTPSQPPIAVVLFIHGFAEHVHRYAHFHPLLASRGIAVFAFDQRGFGRTALDKEKGSGYGRTSWEDQMRDIEWAVGVVREKWEGVKVVLMGHSMGGGEVLGFGCELRYASTATSLAGVISTSPLILQTKPASKVVRWIGGKASHFSPYKLIPTEIKPECLSHDPAVGEAYMKDPLVKLSGSLKGLNDMLNLGEYLLKKAYQNWPKDVPALIHGTDDQVTSCKASQAFYDKVVGSNKKIKLYEGAYHEIHNEPDGVKAKLAEDIIAWIEDAVGGREERGPRCD